MPVPGKRLKDRIVGLVYGAAYYIASFGLRLSKVPFVGRYVDSMASRDRLRIVTIPVNVKVQGSSAIVPFDTMSRLVDAACYVAAAESCMCRSGHDCKDYPKDLGCLYLGEGARTIKHNVREISKEEALARLERARALGLVNNLVWSTAEFKLLGAEAGRTVEICSCCPCCCLMFKTRNASKAFIDNVLGFGICKVVAPDDCTRCTNCERSCPFKAIKVDAREGPSVDIGRCKGCGRCENACRPHVLKVFPKENDGDFANECKRSTPYVHDYIEQFLAMVR